jgi:pyrroline-5-carboxylate reductase
MPDPSPLVVVGGGKMGEALATGLAAGGWGVTIVETDAGRRAALDGRHQVVDSPGEGSDVVIAVKPGDVETVCRELKRPARVLSIAAGVTLARLESWLPDGTAVVRAMPNTPALVGAGAAAIAGGTLATEADIAWARQVLEAVGTVVELPESALDAVTGLSGSGPAYVFLLAEALIDAGVLVGLPRPVAKQLAVQTLLGAAKLMAETGDEPSALRAAVTSPGGTTAAGLRALEAAGVRHAVLDAVTAAAERSRALGNL